MVDRRPFPEEVIDVPRAPDGEFRDGHGDKVYIEKRATVALHHLAVENGWTHTKERTPYENFRALINRTSDYDRDLDTLTDFAFAYIRGLDGEKYSPRILDEFAEDPDVNFEY